MMTAGCVLFARAAVLKALAKRLGFAEPCGTRRGSAAAPRVWDCKVVLRCPVLLRKACSDAF